MIPGARWLVAGTAVLLLAVASFQAAQLGRADALTEEASNRLAAAAKSGAPLSLEAWLETRSGLQRAAHLAPGDPSVQELLGTLHAQRQGSGDLELQGLDHFVAAIDRRPTSPYTWASYAQVSYSLGRTGQPFVTALRNAAMLGPSEPEVQETVADLGLAVWGEVPESTREVVEGAVARGMARNPARMLQIAERRGRLETACRHVKAEDQRLATSPQAKTCKTMGNKT